MDASIEPTVLAARERVFGLIGTGPTVGTLLMPAISSATPLAGLPADLSAKLDSRTAAGLDVEGSDYPARSLWPRVIAPSVAAGALDAIVLAIAAALGSWRWTIAATVVLAALAALTTAAIVVTRRDRQRLTRRERRALHQAGQWRSRQPWDGRSSARAEYRLVLVAADAAERVANARAWTSGYLDDHRIRLDLAEALDRVDEQAYQLAVARAELTSRAAASSVVRAEFERYDASLAPVWLAAVDRAAALLRYADHVQELDTKLADLAALDRADRRVGRLLTGSVQDEFATDQMRELTGEIGYLRAAIDDTMRLLHSDTRSLDR